MKQISSKRNTGQVFEDGVTLKRRTVHGESLPASTANSNPSHVVCIVDILQLLAIKILFYATNLMCIDPFIEL